MGKHDPNRVERHREKVTEEQYGILFHAVGSLDGRRTGDTGSVRGKERDRAINTFTAELEVFETPSPQNGNIFV